MGVNSWQIHSLQETVVFGLEYYKRQENLSKPKKDDEPIS
jgi:hypothetical protein